MTRLNFYDLDADQRLCYFRWVDPPILSSPEYALQLLREDIATIEAYVLYGVTNDATKRP